MLFGLRAVEIFLLILWYFLAVAERLIAALTSLLPQFTIEWIDVFIKSQIPVNPKHNREVAVALDVASLSSFEEVCKYFGYEVQEHIVRTRDGYILVVHRIIPPRSDEETVGARANTPRPVLFLQHGLLMCSEIWVASPTTEKSFAFVLADAGYDVWLGNVRGNKYCVKHMTKVPANNDFWDFSIDELAMFDIEDAIDYTLGYTGQESLSYVGFSQGSALSFAALSTSPSLNNKINQVFALAPAMAPPALANTLVHSIVSASPRLLYSIFGKRAILRSAVFWQNTVYPSLFIRAIDWGVRFLFNWQSNNMDLAAKYAGYYHLYSYTSVKTVVHWFQILANKRFTLFDVDTSASIFRGESAYRVATFPTRNISSQVVLFYGTADTLVDIDVMLSALPDSTVSYPVEGFEHLEMLWGEGVVANIAPMIIDYLDQYAAQHPSVSSKRKPSDSQFKDTSTLRKRLGATPGEGRYKAVVAPKFDRENSELVPVSTRVGKHRKLSNGSISSLKSLGEKGFLPLSSGPLTSVITPVRRRSELLQPVRAIVDGEAAVDEQ